MKKSENSLVSLASPSWEDLETKPFPQLVPDLPSAVKYQPSLPRSRHATHFHWRGWLHSLFIYLSYSPLPWMSHGCGFLSLGITIVFVQLGLSLPQIVANTPSWLASAPSAPPTPPLGTQHHLHASMENSASLRGSSTSRMRHQLLQPTLHSNSDSTRFFSGAWDFLGSLKIKAQAPPLCLYKDRSFHCQLFLFTSL